MRIGSEEHKRLFCETFLAAHREYDPAEFAWPELSDAHMDRLRAIPFWRTALGVEQNAGRMVSGFAETIEDPLLRRAVALQGYEETRHARLLSAFIEHYKLPVEPPPLPKSVPTRSNFTVFGYEECLDSYFGFGIFGIASRMDYMPAELMRLMEPILIEEAQHIVFFVNWVAYQRVQDGFAGIAPLLSAYGYVRAILRLVATASGVGAQGTGFIAPGASSVGASDLTPRSFLESCDLENRKHMSIFDPRLLQPRVLPVLGSLAVRLLAATSLIPKAAATR